MKAFSLLFTWIFFVLLVHEINIRPVKIVTIQPPNWYHLQVKTSDCQGKLSLVDVDKNNEVYALFSWGQEEISIGMFVSIKDGGISTKVLPEIMINKIEITSIPTWK